MALLGATACDNDDTGEDVRGFCDAVDQFRELSVDGLDFSSPEALEASMAPFVETIDILDAEPPPRVETEVQFFVDTFRGLATVYEKYDYDVYAIRESPEFNDYAEVLDSEAAGVASDALARFEARECH